MIELRALIIVLVLSLLSACSDSSEKKQATETKPSTKTKNPLDGYIKTIDKAKDVEKKILEAAEKQRKTLEAIEQNNKSTNRDN